MRNLRALSGGRCWAAVAGVLLGGAGLAVGQDPPQATNLLGANADSRLLGFDVNIVTERHFDDPAAQLRQSDGALTQKTRELLGSYASADDDAAKSTLRDQLSTTVAAHFDVRQQLRDHELKALEEQVQRLRSIQERRAREKSQIVAARLDQLIRDTEGIGWGGDEGSAWEAQHSIKYGIAVPPAAGYSALNPAFPVPRPTAVKPAAR